MFNSQIGQIHGDQNLIDLIADFMVSCGWAVVSGYGTLSCILSSSGESGALTKLYARVHQDGAAGRININVRDDAAGTHQTTNNNYIGISQTLDQYYCMAGDKDYIAIFTNSNHLVKTKYAGLLMPIYNNAAYDETYRMVSTTFYEPHVPTGVANTILHTRAGLWNQTITNIYNSESYPLYKPTDLGKWIKPVYIGTNLELIGAFKNIARDGLESGWRGDIYTSIVAGSNSRWIKNSEILMLLEGPHPVFDDASVSVLSETKVATGVIDVFDNMIRPKLLALGWVETDNSPISGYARDYFYHTSGEDGNSNFALRFYINGASFIGAIYKADLSQSDISAPFAVVADVNQDVTVCIDKDCVVVGSEGKAAYYGKLISFLHPDNGADIDYSIVSILLSTSTSYFDNVLRDQVTGNYFPHGAADYDTSRLLEGTQTVPCSPNNFDARSKFFRIYIRTNSVLGQANFIGFLKHCLVTQPAVALNDYNANGIAWRCYGYNYGTGIRYVLVRRPFLVSGNDGDIMFPTAGGVSGALDVCKIEVQSTYPIVRGKATKPYNFRGRGTQVSEKVKL